VRCCRWGRRGGPPRHGSRAAGRRSAWRRVELRPSPEPALSVALDGGAGFGDTETVAGTNAALLLEAIPAENVAHPHAVTLGDGGDGVARPHHVSVLARRRRRRRPDRRGQRGPRPG